ncbi:MAG TPA: CHASE domain-containing protein [Gallionella sp.]|nr:CHASE domain-containing protein [Gallionella sp.]
MDKPSPMESAVPARPSAPRLRPELLVSVLVFAMGLLATYWIWHHEHQRQRLELQSEFDSGIRESMLKIEQRLQNYQNVLLGVQALYEASQQVEPAEFAAYVATLQLAKNHPGIQSLGYSPLVPAEQLARHLADIRKQGAPNYRIKPEGQRKLYAPVIHIAPFHGRNLRVFGLDNYASPERRAALEQARDSGQASFSGKLTLVQDDNTSQASILMFLPIYRNGMVHDTTASRRAAIAGWVSAAFRLNSMMSGLLAPQSQNFDIEIYDGAGTSPGALLYDSDNDAKRGIEDPVAAFQRMREVRLGGRSWTISFASTPAFDDRLSSRHIRIEAVIGALASLLLAVAIWLLLRSRKQTLHDSRQLQEAIHQAEMASRAKSEFLANIGHELRTPMNAILGMTHLALAEETEPGRRTRLEKIQFSGEHLLNTIDNILDYSGMEYGISQPHPTDFTLGELIADLDKLMTSRAASKKLALSIDIAPDLSARKLHGEAGHLKQVLLNLLDNAVKFTPPDGHIGLAVVPTDENDSSIKLRFEVWDTGIGIDRKNLRHLFSPFWQEDSSLTRSHEGIGLGLAICKKMVDRMKEGELGLESEPGHGSTFWLCTRLDKARAERHKTAGNRFAHIRGARILVTEDNVLSQTILGGLLESAGAIVQYAHNGIEALEQLRRNRIELVLMDVQMPEMDGFETTRAIRNDPALAELPVIALTAHASRENRRRCLETGMSDFLGKPFTPAALYAKLAYWLPPRHDTEERITVPAVAAAPVPAHSDGEIIDLKQLAELIGDDRAKMREFAGRFVELARRDMDQIDNALEHNDNETLGRLAHHNKAPAKMVGARGFADLCQELSDLSKRSADPAQLRKTVAQMRPQLDRIEQRVRQELAH